MQAWIFFVFLGMQLREWSEHIIFDTLDFSFLQYFLDLLITEFKLCR